ncbi:MAG TPA: hypothetical protein VJU14_13310 [Solirubrobacterales bacterium]|nr:hypothetical protein [Solirubrobacterales bacterium]
MPESLPSFPVRAVLAVFAVAVLALCVKAAPADADAFGPQFPINSPTHVAEGMNAGFQDVAYNTVSGQYLVVYVAATTPTEDDIYGQLLDAVGNKVGPEFRISAVSQGHEEYNPATVNFDSETGRYLVVWDRDETVFARLLAPNGTPLSGELPISAVQDDIETEAIAYSPAAHEYLVVWKAFGEGRVYTQRLNQDGAQVGGDDVIVGGGTGLRVDDAVDVAYNATSLEYLVVFNANKTVASDGEEVFGQRLNLAGAEVGLDDFPISEMGPVGSTSFNAAPPSVAWNSVLNQYLVSWHGNDGAPLANNEREVYGQLLAADGTAIGPDDFRISDLGPDGSGEYNASRPRIAFDLFSNQYLVAWHGDEVGLGEDEFEIWGQYLAASGAEIGSNDFRISEGADGDDTLGNNRPTIAFNPTATCNYLVTYFSGDPNDGFDAGSTVFGRFATAPPACPRPDTLAPAITGLKVTPKVIASGLKAPKKASKQAKAKKVKKQAKARYTLSEAAAVTLTVERKLSGRKVKGQCRKAKKGSKAKGSRCAFWVKTGKTLKQQVVAGPNVKGFTARSIRKRGLQPGAYRIVAAATDAAGNSSAKAVARFRVAKTR